MYGLVLGGEEKDKLIRYGERGGKDGEMKEERAGR